MPTNLHDNRVSELLAQGYSDRNTSGFLMCVYAAHRLDLIDALPATYEALKGIKQPGIDPCLRQFVKAASHEAVKHQAFQFLDSIMPDWLPELPPCYQAIHSGSAFDCAKAIAEYAVEWGEQPKLSRRPDAWRYVHPMRLELIEVRVTKPMDAHKLYDYARLADILEDYIGLEIVLTEENVKECSSTVHDKDLAFASYCKARGDEEGFWLRYSSAMRAA